MAEAILRSLAAKAAQGHRLHQKLFLDLYAQSEASQRERDERILDGIIEYKAQAERVLERCKATGEKPPDLIMHPDDIQIDVETGEITITGPTAWERKAADKKWRAMKEIHRQEITSLERDSRKRKILRCAGRSRETLRTPDKYCRCWRRSWATRNRSQRSKNNVGLAIRDAHAGRRSEVSYRPAGMKP